MAEKVIPNAEFLQHWRAGTITNALTEIESLLVEERVQEIERGVADVLSERKVVAEQSGDNWHDGAFRATDEASLRLREQYSAMREARKWPVVALPERDSVVASLGSRALIRLGTTNFYCDFVGLSTLHTDNDETEIATLKSDMGKGVIGMQVGTEVEIHINGRRKKIELLSVEPSPALNAQTSK